MPPHLQGPNGHSNGSHWKQWSLGSCQGAQRGCASSKMTSASTNSKFHRIAFLALQLKGTWSRHAYVASGPLSYLGYLNSIKLPRYQPMTVRWISWYKSWLGMSCATASSAPVAIDLSSLTCQRTWWSRCTKMKALPGRVTANQSEERLNDWT